MLFAGNGSNYSRVAKLGPGNPNHVFLAYVVFELKNKTGREKGGDQKSGGNRSIVKGRWV